MNPRSTCPDTAETRRSAYELLGGRATVAAVVDDLYRRILDDPALVGRFAGVDLARVRRHQVRLLTEVLGGPPTDPPLDVAAAHEGRGIGEADFARVCAYLVSALIDAGAPEQVVAVATRALTPLRPAVVDPLAG